MSRAQQKFGQPAELVVKKILPALNDMIDITTSRTVALRTRMSVLILTLLFGVSLLSALLAGQSMAQHPKRCTPCSSRPPSR